MGTLIKDMREDTLRDFFLGTVNARTLATDISGSLVRVSEVLSEVRVVDMKSDFSVERPMLVALCDAVSAGEIPPEDLKIIGFTLLASDHFTWDGDKDGVLADVISDWSAPEINYPLTLTNVERFRRWLTLQEPYPNKPALQDHIEGRVYEILKKKSVKRLWSPRS